MPSGLLAFLFALGTVTLAEMGDKTQLLAMAFASKYKAYQVIIGVFIATVLNHALAVVLGNLLARYEPIRLWVQAAAALSFILFGLWTIKGDELEGEDKKKTKYGPVMTVVIAFFLAEMGDKTQLATVALSAKFPESPLSVLAGTTTGMLLADGIGIVVMVVLSKKIPERTMKVIAALAFIVFGFIGSYQVLSLNLRLAPVITVSVLSALALVTGVVAIVLFRNNAKKPV